MTVSGNDLTWVRIAAVTDLASFSLIGPRLHFDDRHRSSQLLTTRHKNRRKPFTNNTLKITNRR